MQQLKLLVVSTTVLIGALCVCDAIAADAAKASASPRHDATAECSGDVEAAALMVMYNTLTQGHAAPWNNWGDGVPCPATNGSATASADTETVASAWDGVTCSSTGRQPCVQGLDRSALRHGDDIDGTLPGPTGVCALKRLESLSFNSATNLKGSLPSCMSSQLTSLVKLDVSGTQLSGTLAADFFTPLVALEYLDLSSSGLKGPLPTFSLASPLQLLRLDATELGVDTKGTFPEHWCKLQKLTTLSLSRMDALDGAQLPSCIGELTALETLDVSVTGMVGPLPASLFDNCRNATSLRFSRFMNGTMPSSVGGLSRLHELLLPGALTGTLPDSVWSLPQLQTLYYDAPGGPVGAFLSATLPDTIGDATQLVSLTMRGALTGSLPASMSRLTRLENVALESNALSGCLPDFANWTRVTSLTLFDNRLGQDAPRGEECVVPRSISQLGTDADSRAQPLTIDLHSNELTGEIPDVFVDLVGPHASPKLDFSRNRFVGSIPESLTRVAISDLTLQQNLFTGTIAASVFAMPHGTIDLSNNLLSGSIPDTLWTTQFEGLDLSNNDLSGTVPGDVSRMAHPELVTRLSLARNARLTGQIPDGIGNLSDLQGTLDLSECYFTGTLPATVGQLTNLYNIDVSHNFIGGTLPELPATAGHHLWQWVNVSHNLFEGAIPATWAMLGLDAVFARNCNLDSPLPEQWNPASGSSGPGSVSMLDLAHNAITGTLPASLGTASFISVDLSYNQLAGEPWPLQGGSSGWQNNRVGTLDLSHNYFTGALPLGEKLNGATSISLSSNNFTAFQPCPDDQGGASFLNVFDFSDNNIVAELSDACLQSLGRKPLRSFVARGNAGLQLDVGVLVSSVPTLTTVDLGGTGAYGWFPSSAALSRTPFLTLLWVTGCRFVTGALADDPHGLVSIDITGTAMQADALPAFLTSGDSLPVAGTFAACKRAVSTDPRSAVAVAMDNAYDNYTRCECLPGYEGQHTSCARCPLGSFSVAGRTEACATCPAGSYQRQGTAQDGPFTCEPCADDLFAPAGTRAGACFACPPGSQCVGGRLGIGANRWWPGRLRMSPSAQLYECLSQVSCPPAFYPNVSALSTTGITATCETGYSGPLCAVCDAGRTLSKPGVCVECPHPAVSTALSVVCVAVACLFVACTLRRDSRRRKDAVRGAGQLALAKPLLDVNNVAATAPSDSDVGETRPMADREPLDGRAGATAPDRGPLARAAESGSRTRGRSALRTLVSYLQVLSMTTDFRARVPLALEGVLGGVATIGGDSLAKTVSSEMLCPWGLGFRATLYAAAMIPVAAAALSCTWVLGSRIYSASVKRSSRPQHEGVPSVWHDVVAGTWAVFFLVYTRVAKVAITGLKAHSPAVDGVTYLEADFRINSSPDGGLAGVRTFAVIMCCVYVVGVPAASFAVLYRSTRRTTRLSSEEATASLLRSPLSLLVRGYRPEAWWWEGTVICRKVVFATLAAFVTQPILQASLACGVLFVLTLLHVWHRPHTRQALNAVETMSLAALFATSLGTVLFEGVPSLQVSAARPYGGAGGTMLALTLALVNALTVALLVRQVYVEAPWRSALSWIGSRARGCGCLGCAAGRCGCCSDGKGTATSKALGRGVSGEGSQLSLVPTAAPAAGRGGLTARGDEGPEAPP